MGSLNKNILFNRGMGRSRPRSKHKYAGVKVQNDIRTSPHIYKQIFPIFNCVSPERVSLTSFARQNSRYLHNSMFLDSETQDEIDNSKAIAS